MRVAKNGIYNMNWDVFFRNTLSLAPLAISLLSSNVSFAIEETAFTEDDIFIDIPQVISATHLSQKLTEVPAAITIIDRSMIDASGAIKVSDLFRLVPGMQAYDIHTNKSGVTYHGMSDDFPNKLEVMINSRSVYLPLLSTVAWETMGLTIDDIEYIEVVRGSNVPTHGSNAFLGAINIITRSPIKDHSTELRTTFGALDTQNYTLRHAASTDELQYSIAAGYESNHGIDLFSDSGTSRYLNVSASLTPSLTDNIDLEFGFTSGFAYRGDGDADTSQEAGFSRRNHDSNYQLIRWNRVQSNHKEVSLTYYHNYLNLDSPRYTDEELQRILEAGFGSATPDNAGAMANALNPLGIYQDSEHGQMDLHDLEILQTVNHSSVSNLALGAGIRFQRTQSEVLFSTPSDQWHEELRYRLFGNWDYRPFKKWVFNTGAMFEHSSVSGNAFSPRIAANYLMDEGSSIRAAYTLAHRMPSLLDTQGNYKVVYPLGAGTDILSTKNPNLEPEKNHSFEIGYIKLWPNNHTQFESRIFYEDINGGIDAFFQPSEDDTFFEESGSARTQDNISDWVSKGIEFQFKQTFPDLNDTMLVLNYGFNNTSGQRNRGLKGIDSLDKRAPKHTASALISTKPSEDFLLGLTYYYMDHTEWLEGFSFNSPTNNYNRFDLTARYDIPLDFSTTLQASVIVQNLFDHSYSEFYRFNEFGRRAYLQLKLSY